MQPVRRTLIVALAAVALAAIVVPLTSAASQRTATTVVSVSGKEFKYTLSRKSAPRGAIVFKFKNVGVVAHDFKIAGKKTPLVQPGSSATLKVKITKPGRYKYLCTVPGHAAAGMKGIFIVK
jgi:plastocyanin